jgi:hypothetical protein
VPTPKSEATRVAETNLAEKADAVERLIEEKIRDGNLQISLGEGQLPKGTTLSVLQVIANRYESAGWTAHFADDQRDGLYIAIS